MPAGVPTLTSLCIGTTQPLGPRRMMTWLPDWRIFAKPRRSRALTIAAPEVRGSLGIRRKAEHGYYGMPWSGKRKLGQIERGRLFQMGDCFFHRFTLRGGTRLGVERDIPAFFGRCKNSGQFHGATSRRKCLNCRAFQALTPNEDQAPRCRITWRFRRGERQLFHEINVLMCCVSIQAVLFRVNNHVIPYLISQDTVFLETLSIRSITAPAALEHIPGNPIAAGRGHAKIQTLATSSRTPQ